MGDSWDLNTGRGAVGLEAFWSTRKLGFLGTVCPSTALPQAHCPLPPWACVPVLRASWTNYSPNRPASQGLTMTLPRKPQSQVGAHLQAHLGWEVVLPSPHHPQSSSPGLFCPFCPLSDMGHIHSPLPSLPCFPFHLPLPSAQPLPLFLKLLWIPIPLLQDSASPQALDFLRLWQQAGRRRVDRAFFPTLLPCCRALILCASLEGGEQCVLSPHNQDPHPQIKGSESREVQKSCLQLITVSAVSLLLQELKQGGSRSKSCGLITIKPHVATRDWISLCSLQMEAHSPLPLPASSSPPCF